MDNKKRHLIHSSLSQYSREILECRHEYCNNRMCKGHYYSKGFLKNLKNSSNKIYLLEHSEFESNNTSKKIFSEIGINQLKNTLSGGFRWFCNNHDHELFSPIESDTENIDFLSIKNCNLISLRSALHEYHKVTIWLKIYNEYKNSINRLKRKIYDEQNWDKMEVNFNLRKIVFGMQIEKLKHNISEDKKDFNYMIFHFPKNIEIYFHCILPIINLTEKNKQEFFISVIPRKNDTVVIFGGDCDKKILLKHMSDTVCINVQKFLYAVFSNEIQILKDEEMQNDILRFINYCILTTNQPFCCSEDFFLKNIEPQEEKIFEEFSRLKNNTEKPNIYIFEGDNPIPLDQPVIMFLT